MASSPFIQHDHSPGFTQHQHTPTGLTFWRDLTPFPRPLRVPTANSPCILIVGGGVTGLITAWVLLDKGYKVTIISKEWASYGKSQRLTSQIAGALWEYPPAVCGQHTDAMSLQFSKRWCMISYHIWDAIASTPTLLKDVGVQMRPADFFFPVLIEEDASQLSKMQEIEASGVKGFRRDPHIIYERGVNPAYGAIDAYEHLSPIIDTDQAMAWLMRLIKTKGAILHTRTVHGDLIHQETSLLKEFSASIMINATGLSSAETASDTTCYPLRGGILRVLNNGIDFPKIEAALTISADAAQDNEIVFIVPRNDDILLIGGIAEEREETIELGVESEKVRRMRGRCEVFLPVLREARLDPGYPFAQGLRPARRSNVRVERDVRSNGEGGGQSRIIHSYGHGGSGWTLSFGCAGDVATLVEEALLGAPLRSKM